MAAVTSVGVAAGLVADATRAVVANDGSVQDAAQEAITGDPAPGSKKDRLRGALLGAFIADALAAPYHWFYKPSNIPKYVGEHSGYVRPAATHVESMMQAMGYEGSVDIFKDKKRLYDAGDGAEASRDEHGNLLPRKPEDRPHYHATLDAGEPTVDMTISRIAIKLCGQGSYTPGRFLEQFEAFFTAPEAQHNDAYLAVFIRRFFENRSRGNDLANCARDQRDIWSIGSHGGLMGALPVLAYYHDQPEALASARAIEHHMTTHRSLNLAASSIVINGLFRKLLGLSSTAHKDEEGPDGGDAAPAGGESKEAEGEAKGAASGGSGSGSGSDGKPAEDAPADGLKAHQEEVLAAIKEAQSGVRLPKIRGDELFKAYRDAKGPGKIPKDKMWRLHTELAEQLDVEALMELAESEGDGAVVGGRLATACYTEHGVPAALFLMAKYAGDFRKAVLVNARLGGDCTARGAILGFLMGASVGYSGIPRDLVEGLKDGPAIVREIDSLVDRAASPGWKV